MKIYCLKGGLEVSSKVIYNNTIEVFNMKDAVITIKLNKKIKEEFQRFCDDVGLNPSVAINMYINHVVYNQQLPFEVKNLKPNKKLMQAIENVENKNNISKQFNSIDELFEDLND